MRQRRLLALTTSAVLVSAAGLSAQGGSAPSPRPFERLFSPLPAARPTPSLAPQWFRPPALPANREKCDAAVLPADTRIIRRMSIAPPASRQLTIRDAIKPGCR